MLTPLTLAIDAMGGDFGPVVTVPAALQFLACHPRLRLLLVGDPDRIAPFLIDASSDALERLQVIPAESVIAGHLGLAQALRHSRGTSMRVAIELIKEGKAHACVTAGNTGVLMGLAKLLLKPFAGIERPALMGVFPHQQKGNTVVLDLGANVEPDSAMLVQFAVMGAVMAEEVLEVTRPKVALLNIGQEETKGLRVIKEASQVLKSMPEINYTGYVEGHDLLTGKVDVIVCDGFTGNVMLKTMEGVFRIFLSLLKVSNQKQDCWWTKLGTSWFQKRFIRKFKHLNPDRYNGACLSGLCGMVIKSHGAANQRAFIMAIERAEQTVRRNVQERMASRLHSMLPPLDFDLPLGDKSTSDHG